MGSHRGFAFYICPPCGTMLAFAIFMAPGSCRGRGVGRLSVAFPMHLCWIGFFRLLVKLPGSSPATGFGEDCYGSVCIKTVVGLLGHVSAAGKGGKAHSSLRTGFFRLTSFVDVSTRIFFFRRNGAESVH